MYSILFFIYKPQFVFQIFVLRVQSITNDQLIKKHETKYPNIIVPCSQANRNQTSETEGNAIHNP